MKNYLQTLNLRNNLLVLGILCALFDAIYPALDNFTVHHLIVAEDKLTAAFAYLIVGGWTGTIAGLFFALKFGKKLIDEDFNGFIIDNLSMHKNAFLEGSLTSVSTLFIMLGHQIGDPSVIAALSNLTIIYTLFYDVWKGQARLNNLIFPVVITIIGAMMSTFSGSLQITLLAFLFVVIISNGFGAFSEIIQQKGAKVSDSVNFFIWRFFWLALTGTFLAFIVSNQRGYLTLLLETIKMGLFNLHWVILTMFFVFLAIGLKLYLKKSQAVSIVLVILALKLIFSYPITFAGNWFKTDVFGELPNNPSIWIIRIIGSFLIIWGVIKLNNKKLLITKSGN